jgi:iron complex transport system permease protein
VGGARWSLTTVCVVGAGLVALGFLASRMVGPDRIDSPLAVFRALTGQADDLLTAAVRGLRLPRTLVAVMVGAGLAVAGALIQAVTRNPIVEPSILGINSGAALSVAIVTYLSGWGAIRVFGIDLVPFVAFAGAAAAVVMVFAFVGTGGATPGRIALAGVTVALLANALVMGVVILNEAATRYLIHFLVGGFDAVTWPSVTTLLPYAVVGLGLALVMSRPVTVLSLGDDVAHGLGLPVRRMRLYAIGLVVVLAGAAVAVAGPISMVGLLVPHAVRWLVGTDYVKVLTACLVAGPVLLLAADVVSRLLVRGTEIPVGVMTAVIGTPYFILLARRGKGAV